ncbi:MAG: gamma-glutamyl-gamma-aminobutyrate hydrolase family protein [Pleurocapsa minor GSE-CHR-MK-17-07R]|jgi:putative glutamine amidotransferase|nr:gamma-glutamyl-gamma-aminobutyrate hydrolase family protein [Pleurocapsa minor GSE-CHR-MK 17-07R]
MTRPLIGITSSSIIINGNPYNRMYAPNARAIAEAGGLPVYIPTHMDTDTLREIYDRLDGLLLPGGPDVDPAQYNADRHPQLGLVDDARDAIELTLARWSVSDDMPTFGICRGHQVLNVALGGTLIQDIPSQVDTDLHHDISNETPRATRIHDITIQPDSRLASILGTTHVQVNSIHHQSVELAAPNAVVTASAPDGVVEALEVPGKAFVLSVQWHPEDLYQSDDGMRRLFQTFVDAARERMLARG